MVITSQSTESYVRREAGGKGYNLYLLSNAGFSVPEWSVLGSSSFKSFREATKFDEKLKPILAHVTAASNLEEIEKQIKDLIMSSPLPPLVEQQAHEAYAPFKGKRIAVRSSAHGEDSAKLSFAGQLSTFLFVKSEADALQKLKECWASAYSARGLSYRLQNKISLQVSIEVAVIFQEMLDSEKSGVLFTCDPVQGRSDQMIVNSVYGVGEGLVSGLLDADSFTLNKSDGAVINQELAEKTSQLVQGDSHEGTQEVPVPAQFVKPASLNLLELQTLAELGRNIEKFYRFPQDVEWGYRNDRFYLLQSRPVTTVKENSDGILYVWDNSNIVESYGGITLPLSFSFAHHNYHWVYVQFCEILRIPQKEIRKMDYFLRNMLGIFYGRIYYNLLNWYKLTSILPGFKYNRSFMETMMGTQHSLADEIADRIKPPGFQETTASKVRRTLSGIKFLYFHFTIQDMVDEFLKYFHEVYSKYRHLDYSRIPSDEIQRYYQEVENRLLLEWKAPIVNDYLCMVHFGLLKKLTSKWLPQLGESFQNDLLCGEGNLESAEPTRELIRMAAMVAADPQLKKLLEETRSEDCMEAIKRSGFKAFYSRVERYIDLYGFRCMNEMKLEEIDLYQDPGFLFVCLKNYQRTGQVDLDTYELREKEIRRAAEAKISSNLSGVKRFIYLWSLKNARKAVRNRENTRFCRTRIYGVARAMFNGIGRDFAARGMIERPEDVFYLLMNEVFGAIEATTPAQDLAALVDVRKKQYDSYENIEPASRFITRGPTYVMNNHFPADAPETNQEILNLPENCLKGSGCCPGIVEGIVKVVLSPKDNLELNREILVTLRTDPGWIPLYPSASALLVERGGLLSHSAIVAREMGLPTVVGIKGLTQKLKSGMRVRINGETGLVEILSEAPQKL